MEGKPHVGPAEAVCKNTKWIRTDITLSLHTDGAVHPAVARRDRMVAVQCDGAHLVSWLEEVVMIAHAECKVAKVSGCHMRIAAR